MCFENVSFDYEADHSTLKNLSFDAQPGQQVALVGPSGSGKSTLVSLILRLYDPSEGRILIDGEDIRQYTLDSLRQQISVVLQDSVLFGVSIRDNIAYGKLGATDAEIEQAARLANAHDFIVSAASGLRHGSGGAGRQPLWGATAANCDRPSRCPSSADCDFGRTHHRVR